MCTDEVIAKQLVALFYGRVGTARRLIWPSFMGRSPQAGHGASSKFALRLLGASPGNVFQFPDMTRLGQVFVKVQREDNPLTT